jgi:hypothetical protein
MQIHKWLENADASSGGRPVGEWVAAERILACRGEYIGRKLRCEVPEWQVTHEKFIVAAESGKVGTGITVDFSQSGKDAILADFEAGPMSYIAEKSRPPIRDESSVEVLILSPEGKILSRDSAVDSLNKMRVSRLDTYRKRIHDVKNGKKSKRAEDKNRGGHD